MSYFASPLHASRRRRTATNWTIQGRKARFESPLSVAAGGSRSSGESRGHLTLEWFSPQGLYTVVEVLPLVAPTGYVILDPSLRQQASGVINAAAGFEHRFGSEVTGYASIHSDRSSVVDGSVSNVAFIRWNLVHAAAGATFSTGDTDFTLCVIGAFGTSWATPRSVAGNFDSSYCHLALILGFSFPFGSL